jgi:hypothetical protein
MTSPEYCDVTCIDTSLSWPTAAFTSSVNRDRGLIVTRLESEPPVLNIKSTVALAVEAPGFAMQRYSWNPDPVYPSAKYQYEGLLDVVPAAA